VIPNSYSISLGSSFWRFHSIWDDHDDEHPKLRVYSLNLSDSWVLALFIAVAFRKICTAILAFLLPVIEQTDEFGVDIIC
jgi:hypothetical protein